MTMTYVTIRPSDELSRRDEEITETSEIRRETSFGTCCLAKRSYFNRVIMGASHVKLASGKDHGNRHMERDYPCTVVQINGIIIPRFAFESRDEYLERFYSVRPSY